MHYSGFKINSSPATLYKTEVNIVIKDYRICESIFV